MVRRDSHVMPLERQLAASASGYVEWVDTASGEQPYDVLMSAFFDDEPLGEWLPRGRWMPTNASGCSRADEGPSERDGTAAAPVVMLG